jgi:hypothetical protein
MDGIFSFAVVISPEAFEVKKPLSEVYAVGGQDHT